MFFEDWFSSKNIFLLILFISEHLKCTYCNEIYDKPVTLPCGKVICQYHKDEIGQSLSTNSFECTLCSNGIFPVNELALALLKITPHEIVQSKIIKEFKTNLEKCKNKSNEIQQMIVNDGMDFVFDYCQQLRLDLDIAIEYRKKELDEIGDSIRMEIEKIEKELNEHISKYLIIKLIN